MSLKSCYRKKLFTYRRAVNIGLPGRVKKVILPFEAGSTEEEDEQLMNNTMDSFKPFETKCMLPFDFHSVLKNVCNMIVQW